MKQEDPSVRLGFPVLSGAGRCQDSVTASSSGRNSAEAATQKHATVSLHHHGSAWYAERGCEHPDCKAAAASKKKRLRDNRRTQRIHLNGSWIHPRLAPAGSTVAARHGTAYARREYGCECAPCSTAKDPACPHLA